MVGYLTPDPGIEDDDEEVISESPVLTAASVGSTADHPPTVDCPPGDSHRDHRRSPRRDPEDRGPGDGIPGDGASES